jgi:pyruvate kinase
MPFRPDSLAKLQSELLELHAEMLRAEARFFAGEPRVHDSYRLSAANLIHYLVLRRADRRELQEALAELGLSSLGRAEAHTLANVDAVLRALTRLAGGEPLPGAEPSGRPDYAQGRRLLDQHAALLLGPERSTRRVRILVTLPSEAADDPQLVRGLLAHGMDCARINCAHDGPAAWERMIGHLRRAEAESGRRVRILMDLAGPKLRTGPLLPGPAVLKVRPGRDLYGRVTRPARLWLHPAESPCAAPGPADGVLPIEGADFARFERGQHVLCLDAREAPRRLELEAPAPGGIWARLAQTAYFTPGQILRLEDGPDLGRVGDLPRRPGELRLKPGDRLVLTRSLEPGRPAERDGDGLPLGPAHIGCTLPQAFDQVQPGERIWLDDGRIGGRVRAANRNEIEVEILEARPGGDALRADKGINLPDTALTLPALTDKDLKDLEFVAVHADAVALSFVHDPADVIALEERLQELGHGELGIVLKIETRRAFERLPELLLASMQSPRDGVMIARGDLAVECGFERLAEIQEEILWICEAAHIPVIWATQVLETLAKTGRPSRAEITDAAMSERAECVMLNKGPYIDRAVAVLDDILRRMEGHQRKKSARLRALRLARLPSVLD